MEQWQHGGRGAAGQRQRRSVGAGGAGTVCAGGSKGACPPRPDRRNPLFRASSHAPPHLLPAKGSLLLVQVRPQVLAASCAFRALARRSRLHRGAAMPSARYTGCPRTHRRRHPFAPATDGCSASPLAAGTGSEMGCQNWANNAIARALAPLPFTPCGAPRRPARRLARLPFGDAGCMYRPASGGLEGAGRSARAPATPGPPLPHPIRKLWARDDGWGRFGIAWTSHQRPLRPPARRAAVHSCNWWRRGRGEHARSVANGHERGNAFR